SHDGPGGQAGRQQLRRRRGRVVRRRVAELLGAQVADLALERRDHGGEVARGGRRLPGVVRVVLRVVVVAALPGGGPRLGRGRAAVAAVHGGRDDGAELGLQAGRRALV
ncbi:hypothetical protein DC043_15495, partial [Enterococcus faecalis]